jgi:diguanylate cyclase (GGDEF)-like protein
VISAPFKSTISGQPVVVLTQPLRDADGKLIGILLGAIDLLRPSFSAQLDALRAGADGYLFIVTDQGVMVHHPDKSRILEQGDDQPGTLLEAALRTPKAGKTVCSTTACRCCWCTSACARPTGPSACPTRCAAPSSHAGVRLRALPLGAAMVTVVAGLFGWLITKGLLRPLRRLHRHVEDSAGRANISVFDVVRKDEFGHLSRAFYGLSQRREQAELELHRLATTDVLTGLNNRRMFDAFLPQALARAARSGQPVGLAILDIDHFKTINDTLGHPAGDQVLIEFSRRLTGAVRTTDTVARLAGDEFVIVFEQLSTATEMTLLGEKIVDAMRPPFTLHGQREVGTSIGMPSPRPCATTAEELMRAADQALYGVKAADAMATQSTRSAPNAWRGCADGGRLSSEAP